MDELVVGSWNELQEALFQDSWMPEIGRFRSKYAFRGLSDKEYPLETTLVRLGGDFEMLENHLLRNFRKYAHRSDLLEGDSLWHWLSMAQHYGLPTRLLDWTYSPFIAMHFATANIEKFDVDGAIWAVNYVQLHQMLPHRLRDRLENEGANVFTVEMLNDVVTSLPELDQISDHPLALFLEPPSMDDRIINQYAFFSLMSNPGAIISEWIEQYPEICRKVIIPKELKWEIRDKLDQANITERVLFPGLDGLSDWLRRHYSPRN